MGQLGDGTPDEDGQILDPAWLTVAASTWRYQSGGLMPPDGIIQEVWLEGDVTRVMGRVYGRRAAALMTKGVTAGRVSASPGRQFSVTRLRRWAGSPAAPSTRSAWMAACSRQSRTSSCYSRGNWPAEFFSRHLVVPGEIVRPPA